MVLLCFGSCTQGIFKVRTNTNWSEDKIDSIRQSNKKIIVHFQNGVKAIKNPVFKSNEIAGDVIKYKPGHFVEKRSKNPKNRNLFLKTDSTIIYNQLHVYVNDDYWGQKNVSINNLNFIQSATYYYDKKATKKYYRIEVPLTFIAILIALGLTGLLFADANGLL
jgi:hypothetical protein